MSKSKTIVISDLHLTTNFDNRKFQFLKNIFTNSGQIIINGDFWSYYSCTFDEFLDFKWQELFPFMRAKTIYIHGNHDREN